MGVEDARLEDGTAIPEAGTSTTSSGQPVVDDSGAATDSEPPCAGKDCACVRASDCIDPIFKACEKGLCRECALSPDECPADQYCQASTLQCVPGCKGDAACTTGVEQKCDLTRHRCVECLGDGDCGGGGKKCTSGACGATGCAIEPLKCAADEQCCNDTCVKKLTDPNNCNACGKVCPGGVNGQCCNGKCADTTTDAKNCGSCGRTCDTTQASTTVCADKACGWTCKSGFAHCQGANNSGCDTNVNTPTVCGACSTNCTTQVRNATGARCTSSASVLRCDYNSCNASFVDTDGTRANGCEAPCGKSAQACCPSGPPCEVATERCDATNTCSQCLGKDATCDNGGPNLCCKGCHPHGKCK